MESAIVAISRASMTRATSDATLIESWLRTKDSPQTRSAYRIHTDTFLAWYGGRSLAGLTVDDLMDYRDHLAASGQAAATQAIKLNTIKSLLSYGHKVGYLSFDVGKAVTAAKVSSDLAERILEEWQVMALLNHKELKPRDRLLIRLLYVSGGRVSEIVDLKWRHVMVNGDTGQITVTGKGNKTRAIKLSKATWAALCEYKPAEAQPDDYVFQSQRKVGQEDRNGQLDRSAINKIIARAGQLIDVDGLSPHWFRHSHASHALDKGATVAVVKETLGHCSIAVTSRYLHAKPGDSSALVLGA